MSTSDALKALSKLSDGPNLLDELSDICDQLKDCGAGLDAVEVILMFIESHPNWDLGSPGPLVHFVEKFYKRGYEELLLQSVARRVTSHTAWMLNRVINGESDSGRKNAFIATLGKSIENPGIEESTKEDVREFLGLH